MIATNNAQLSSGASWNEHVLIETYSSKGWPWRPEDLRTSGDCIISRVGAEAQRSKVSTPSPLSSGDNSMRDEIVTESEIALTKDEAPQIYIWAKVSGTIYDYDAFPSAASLPLSACSDAAEEDRSDQAYGHDRGSVIARSSERRKIKCIGQL